MELLITISPVVAELRHLDASEDLAGAQIEGDVTNESAGDVANLEQGVR